MGKVEEICNDMIRQGVPMTPRWCDPGSPEMEVVGVVSFLLRGCGLWC